MKRKFILLFFSILLLICSQVYAASCLNEIKSKNTKDFLNEIPSLNSKLDGVQCENNVAFLKDDVINVQIVMQDGSKEAFALTTANGKLTKIENGGSNKPSYVMTTGGCEFDTFLRSDNKAGAFSYIYAQKKVQFAAVGFWNKFKFVFVKPIMGVILNRIQTPVNIACSDTSGAAQEKGEVGDICKHGGECKTGNCIYDRGEGPDRIYRCSCDPFKLVIEPGCPDNPEYPED